MQKIKVVGFLQNAWSPMYAGGRWPRESWLAALARSRTGQRLKLLACDELDIWYDESTPEIADNPKTVMPADLNHMRAVINEQAPDIIITFGVPAASAMVQIIRTGKPHEYQQPHMMLPHPTYRMVTNDVFLKALNDLKKGFVGPARYMPKKGGGVDVCDDYLKLIKWLKIK